MLMRFSLMTAAAAALAPRADKGLPCRQPALPRRMRFPSPAADHSPGCIGSNSAEMMTKPTANGIVVRQAYMDVRRHGPAGVNSVQASRRAAGQRHGGLAAGQVRHPHIAPKHPLFHACTQRLGASPPWPRSAWRRWRPAVRAPLGPGALLLGIDAMGEPIAKARQRLLDAADVDDVGADAQDHGAATGPAPRRCAAAFRQRLAPAR